LQDLYLGHSIPSPSSSFRQLIGRSLTTPKSTMQAKWTTYLTTQSSSPKLPAVSGNRIEVYHPSLHIPVLKTRAKDSGATTSALLLALLAQSLSANNDNGDLVMGVYHANRTLAPVLAAPTLNLLPLLVRDPFRDIKQVVREIQKDLLEIGGVDMVGASLEEIYNWTGVRVDVFVNLLTDIGNGSSSESILLGEQEADRAIIIEHESGREAESGLDGAYLVSFHNMS